MQTIFKYHLSLTDRQILKLPRGAKILSVQSQRGQLALWAEVESENSSTEEREIMIVGTGNPITATAYTYIGSVIQEPFIWHVFEVL